LRLIEDNGRDLAERIHNILEVARVGTQREGVEAVDPAVVLNEVLKARAGELERRQVKVTVDNGLPLVACHRAYLQQIFDNLISNAVKFSGDRPDPTLNIAAVRDGNQVQFSVTDNGIGIPLQQRERVFHPFVRLHPDVAQGSGIGLTIVKRIVELYGGRVWIEANDPAGSTVLFTLPVLGDLTRDWPSSAQSDVVERFDLPCVSTGSAAVGPVSDEEGKERHDEPRP
jgi:signal transduction histidine kinase